MTTTKKTAKKAPGRPKKDASERLEQFSIRLPPKLKYGLELLARAQHRSLSQAIEWALLVGLNAYEVERETDLSMGGLLDKVWVHDSEMQRLLVIYNWAPALLPFEQLVACELIEKSKERGELYNAPAIDGLPESQEERHTLMNTEPERFMEAVRSSEAERRRLETLFYRFCEACWPAIQEIATERANAGQQTQNVSLLRQLGLDARVIPLEKFLNEAVESFERDAPWTKDSLQAALESQVRSQLRASR